jgi:phosphoribosylformylglycinamidine cyclo-ligase
MGSNGLTSARHDVFNNYLAKKYPESYDNNIPQELAYSGSYSITQEIDNLNIDAGKLVLSPTRTYAPVVAKVLKENFNAVHGMIHCSGGAQTKVLNFVNNMHIIKDNMFEIPPLFKMIQKESATDWKEMYKVFNMGHRFEFYVPQKDADFIIDIAKSFNIDAKIVGHIESASQKKLTVKSEYGIFEY